MAKKPGLSGVRAAFADATAALTPAPMADPPPEEPREFVMPDGKTATYTAGQWPGGPVDRLPPGCPVTPLGVDGHNSYFIDTIGQLLAFDGLEKKRLIRLFRSYPNYLYWAWPRWSEPKKKSGKASFINGLEVDDAVQCLEKAAGDRGLFEPAGIVRGRGAWTDGRGRLIWHSGSQLWVIENGKLKVAPTGEIAGRFYPRRPAIMEPWREPVPVATSPAHDVHALLTTWKWGRPKLDPVIALGGIGCMILSGALPWRSHVAVMGGHGTGKSHLQRLYKALLGSVLIDAANATEAGIRQHMGLDALPVGIDEFEASDDNRRANSIIELARIAASGGRLLRGGADHKGVEFLARNAFLCSGILLPPMKVQDRSRFAVLDLDKLDVGDAPPPVVQEEWGRQLLRALMDAWGDFERAYGDWRSVLRGSGLDGRAQDNYGTLFAIAELMLGTEAMETIGLPVTDAQRLGAMIAEATAEERGAQVDYWRACLEHLLAKPIDSWKGGEKPCIGDILEDVEQNNRLEEHDRRRLQSAGVMLQPEADAALPAGKQRWLLCVPAQDSPQLNQIFEGTRWRDGGWIGSLKQGRQEQVIRPATKVVKLNRRNVRCLVVDLLAYDQAVAS